MFTRPHFRSLIALSCSSAMLAACMRDERIPLAPASAEPGSAQITIHTSKVGRLAKASAIDLASLEVALTAPGEASVTRSFALAGSGSSTIAQAIPGLASLKTWTLTARSLDATGHVIHSGSAAFAVLPRQEAHVNLDLAALYSMLKASLFPVRDSVARCELRIDGALQASEAFPAQTRIGDTVRLAYDYLSTGADHRVRLEAYGSMWGGDTLLYAADTLIRVEAGADASIDLALPWVGPAQPPAGQASMRAALGAVATVRVNGRLAGGPEWRRLAPAAGPTGPVLNSSPQLAYDAAANRLIAFYPSNPAVEYRHGEVSQVWVLTHANGLGGTPEWQRVPVSGTLPDDINGLGAVGYTEDNQLIVYGGCNRNCSPAMATVYRLSNANGLGGPAVWSVAAVQNPQPRSGMEGAYDAQAHAFITFGGNLAFFGTDHDDTRVLSNADGAGTSAWSTLAISGPVPAARSETYHAAWDPLRRRFMVFGGNALIHTCCPYSITQYNDSWVLSDAAGPGTPAWTQLHPAGLVPDVRASGAAAYDPVGNRMFLHGGSQWSNASQGYTYLGDLWQLSHANGLGGDAVWSRLEPSGQGPGPMAGHSAVYDAGSDRLIVVGTAAPGATPGVWILQL